MFSECCFVQASLHLRLTGCPHSSLPLESLLTCSTRYNLVQYKIWSFINTSIYSPPMTWMEYHFGTPSSKGNPHHQGLLNSTEMALFDYLIFDCCICSWRSSDENLLFRTEVVYNIDKVDDGEPIAALRLVDNLHSHLLYKKVAQWPNLKKESILDGCSTVVL